MFLVVQTAFIGDMVLTTPLIARLAEKGPVDVVATPVNAPLLRNNPAVRDVIVYDKRGAHRGVRGFLHVAAAIRRRDVNGRTVPRGTKQAFMAQGSIRSALLMRAAGIHAITGFATSDARWLYSTVVPYSRELHHTARLLSLAGLNRPGETSARPLLHTSIADEEAASLVTSAPATRTGFRFIMLAPGSVLADKRWPYYAELAIQLADIYPDCTTVLTGGKSDHALCEEIVKKTSAAGVRAPLNTAGVLSLTGTAALMKRAILVVTNDSAPLHLASAMNTPTVAIFGATVPALGFGPLSEQHAIVERSGPDCQPCRMHGASKCPEGRWKCIGHITVDEVLAAARTLVIPSLS